MRHLQQDARPVAGVDLGPRGAAVGQALEHGQGLARRGGGWADPAGRRPSRHRRRRARTRGRRGRRRPWPPPGSEGAMVVLPGCGASPTCGRLRVGPAARDDAGPGAVAITGYIGLRRIPLRPRLTLASDRRRRHRRRRGDRPRQRLAGRPAGGLRVTVVDPDPGRGASWVAAGMLAPVTEASFGEETAGPAAGRRGRPLGRLRRRPGRGRRRPTSATGRCGTVVVAVDASDRAVIDELLAFQQAARARGRAGSRPASAGALVPALSPGGPGRGRRCPATTRSTTAGWWPPCWRLPTARGRPWSGRPRWPVVDGAGGGAAGVRLGDGRSLDGRRRGGGRRGGETGCSAGVPDGACPRCAR